MIELNDGARIALNPFVGHADHGLHRTRVQGEMSRNVMHKPAIMFPDNKTNSSNSNHLQTHQDCILNTPKAGGS